jgi:signal transduction histidine kinase
MELSHLATNHAAGAQSWNRHIDVKTPNMKHRTRRLRKLVAQAPEAPAVTTPRRRSSVAGKAGADGGKPRGKFLKESLKHQKELRRLTHQIIAAQERERSKLSHQLQDDILQTLLAIKVRLLLLKHAARHKTHGIKNEIASAQRLVVHSATLIRRLARKLDSQRRASSKPSVTAIQCGVTAKFLSEGH